MITAIRQEIVSTSRSLFSILSRNDSLKMFVVAKDGLKISPSILYELEMSPKRYYRALKQLKDAGLIDKKNNKEQEMMYFHTTFGSVVYQRIILELSQYTRHLEKMQMIDTIRRSGKFSEAAILKLTQEIMDSVVKPSFPFPIPESISNKVDIILSFDSVIQKLVQRIDCCKNELLVSTRICPEIVINKILEKSKLGVKVKVVADIDLVKEYFRSQKKFVDNPNEQNPVKERKCVIANPWYPDKTINRRIADIPFGMIILDNSEVGIELVNSNNPGEFCGGIFIRDQRIAMIMTEFYQQLWEKASETTDAMQ
jgi:DNA-binding PadR family transcriptional regulator